MKDVLLKTSIKKKVSGEYKCEGVTKTGRRIKLLVPVSTFSKILEHIEKNIFEAMLDSLFKARYDQHVASRALGDDLGTLDSREVDGLFSDIRAKKRQQEGGFAKSK